MGKDYNINIKEEPKKDEATNKLIKVISSLRDAVLSSESTYKNVSQKDVSSNLTQLLQSLNKNQKNFNAAIDKLGKIFKIEMKPDRPSKDAPDLSGVTILDKQLKSLSGDLQALAKKFPQKEIAVVDLETGPIKKGGTFGGKVDLITQVGVLVTTLKDLVTKTTKELEEATKKIYIKVPKEVASTKAEYKQLMSPLEKKGVMPIPWEKLIGHGSMEFKEAMSEVANVIKKAEVIIGHNIEQFDMKVLNDALKSAGVQIELAAKEYYDTLIASRKQFPKRTAYNLSSFEKDMVLAVKKYAENMHEASHDVNVTADVVKALTGSSKELEAAENNLSGFMTKLSDKIEHVFKQMETVGDKVVVAEEDLVKTIDKMDKESSAVIDSFKKISQINVKDLSQVRSSIKAAILEPAIIKPIPKEIDYTYKVEKGAEGGPYRTGQSQRMVSDVARSLKILQDSIVESLQKGLKKGANILQTESGEYFKLGKGEREWELKIVDVAKIKRELREAFDVSVPKGIDTKDLVDAYKQAFVKSRESYGTSGEDMAMAVYDWLRRYGKEEASKKSEYVKDLYKEFRSKGESMIGQLEHDPNIERVYKATALQAEALEHVTEQFMKVLTIPTARVTKQGTLSFETKYGAERALANFATINTGFERLASEIKALGASAMESARYTSKVATIPLRPSPEERGKAEELSSEMIGKVKELGGTSLLAEGYREAIKLRKAEQGATKDMIDEFDSTKMAFSTLEKEADRLNISALDVANALNQINFENFYDILNKLYKAGKIPFLEGKAQNVMQLEGNLRDIAKVKDELLGVLPLVEPGRPKRREYEEQLVKIFTKPTEELVPERQKQHIRDVALLWDDMVSKAEKVGKTGLYAGKEYLGLPKAKPIDLSDAASSQLTQFNVKFESSLRELNKTMVSASTQSIRGLAPFEQFSSIGRQMSYAANAIAGGLAESGKFEIPSLVSSKEADIIKSGKYGTGGYGVNVLTELRNTASTFEDQIVISGKLAKAFTEIVKPLVRPAAEIGEGVIGEIIPGYKKVSGKGKELLKGGMGEKEYADLISGISDKIQDMLGVPVKEKSRADVVKISENIENVMRTHRGESIEVQTAKIAETFLNYFGRKLSTRFGTKGVSVSPLTPPTEIKELKDITKLISGGFKLGVAPGEGLGYAKMPRSVGQMMAEMFEEYFKMTKGRGLLSETVTAELSKQLRESGNKFIIDLFKDASKGLVTEAEAGQQRDLFKKSSTYFKRIFDVDLPKDMEGIKRVQKEYTSYFKELGEERAPFELKPIEARISSRGIAKRGLMPEPMEAIINNLIGSTEGVTVLQDKINDSLIASKELNEYLKALGYEPLKDIESMRRRLEMEGAKEPEIKELEQFEKKWKVYTDTINEFGKQVQSLVGPKFLQVVEEPHIYKDWSEKDIEKGIKGERLNFQAFAAYAGIFGAGSSMMQELAEATSLSSREGWELIKALQMLDPSLKNFKQSLMESLKEVKLVDISEFSKRTAKLKDLENTIFDIAKFPQAFKVKIPTTTRGAEKFYEELYVPAPALRSTYQEELMGGKVAPTEISRYLSNLINAAKDVEGLTSLASKGEGVTWDTKAMDKFSRTFRSELTEKLTKTYNEIASIESRKQVFPASIASMEGTIEDLKKLLSPTRSVMPIYAATTAGKGRGMQTELEAVEAYEEQLRREKSPKLYTNLMGRIMDMVIGVQPESLRKEESRIEEALKKYKETGQIPSEYAKSYEKYGKGGKSFEDVMESFKQRLIERKAAPTIFELELEANNLEEFADKIGINLEISIKEAIERSMAVLSRAKTRYFEELAKSVIGPKKAIEQTFFQRTIPAITGKAITAVTDKTEELTGLLNLLEGKDVKLKLDIPNIDSIRNKLKELIEDHKEYIAKSRQMGLPVLKEKEIGLSPLMAKALKIKTATGEETNLAKLIKSREKMSEKELEELKTTRDVFVESVRYPFYGTVSVQPHKARLTTAPEAKYSMAVPGAPELDVTSLNEIFESINSYIYGQFEKEKLVEPGLIQKREEAWAEGTEEGASKAKALTEEINSLISIVKQATPTFIDMEQKLDFDGDALFLHTGQLEKSRKEIEHHFNALGEDITSVRSLFSTLFTSVKETEVKSLSEMAYIFQKKHPAAKGYEWLTKPYIEENVGNLDLKEVMKGLFAYTPAGGRLKPEESGYEEQFKLWSSKFMETEILPDVFRRLGVEESKRLEQLLLVDILQQKLEL